MDSVGNVGQVIHHNHQQINKTSQSEMPYTDKESGVFTDALNNQGSERPAALNFDAVRPLLMQLIAMLNSSLGNGMQSSSNTDNNNAARTAGSESPVATSIGNGFQSSLVDNTPFVGSTRVDSTNNTNGVANTVIGGANTHQASNFGSPIAGGIQAVLGNATSSSSSNDTGNTNPSHWRRGSSSSGFRL